MGAGGPRAIALGGGPLFRLANLSARLSIIGPRLVHSRIGETSVFVQSGKKISELPVVVKKVQNVFELYKQLGIKAEVVEDLSREKSTATTKVITSHMSEEEREVIGGFNRCINASSIFRLLETIPPDEVTPPVAAHALRKITELEAGAGHPAPQPEGVRETIRGVGAGRRPDTFLRIAFVSMLVDIICRSKNPDVILDGLSSAMRDNSPGQTYKERFLEELFDSSADLNMSQICRAIHIVSVLFEDKKLNVATADKFWVGLMDKGRNVKTGEQIVEVFSTLPLLGKSRHMVLRLLEDRCMQNWTKLQTGHILNIFRVLTELKYDRVSPAFLRTLSGWLALHIHTVTEQEMLAIIWGFIQVDYCDDAVVKAVEKMMKKKGLQIKEADLISTICSFCTHFRIRSPHILNGVGQYLVDQHVRLEPAQVCAISQTFGTLDFHPPNGFKFWEVMENYLEHKFVKFSPLDMINMLVSFVYIERYPLNFTNKVFNPYFLDRLHAQPDELIALSRAELKLFDSAMNLSCRGYKGPFLPKDTNYKPIRQDMRAVRLSGKLLEPLADVVGGDITRLGRLVVLSSLPLHPLFIVDLMIYPSHAASLNRFGFKTNNSSNTAVLILTPEDYDRSGEHLMGSQTMRVRLLKMMGFKVMTVKLQLASQLLIHPRKLREYLQEQYREANMPPKELK